MIHERQEQFAEINGAAWLARKLILHGCKNPFEGQTTVETRKASFREQITAHGLALVIAGEWERKPLTYKQAFEKFYGEKL